MTINQIYSTINDIASVMKTGVDKVVDTSSFISFGQTVITSTENKEQFYKALVDRIGLTVYAIREYKRQNRNVTVDAFTFGSILQKISYKLQDAESNSTWDKTPLNPYTLEPKEGILQTLYAQDLPTFCYTDVVLDRQLESAFINERNMAGFINGLYIRATNALELSCEGMDNLTICALVTEVFNETKTGINKTRARNLFEEYKKEYQDTTLTIDSCLNDKAFLQFCCVEMGTIIPFLGKLTSMFNNGEVERVTKTSDLIVELNTEFEKKYSVYLSSNTFHDEMVRLPNYTSIPYWYNPSEPMTVQTGTDEEPTKIENVIAVFRDKDACVNTLDTEKQVSMYDVINERTYVKWSADRRYIVDTSENCVIFYIAEPTEDDV